MSGFGIDVERRPDGIAWVVVRNPGKRNALRLEMWEAIPAAMTALGDDRDVRVVVLRGHGDEAFASGADISEFGTHRRDAASAVAYETTTMRAFAALRECPKPVVAMLQGVCIGGGLAVAISADLRIAADDTRMALPPARLGIGYHLGGVERLVELVGPSSAADLLFTAREVAPDEALRIGLVNSVVPKTALLETTEAVARDVARNAPLTIRAAKRAIAEVARDPAARDTRAVEALVAACFDSADYAEGVRAFLDKRQPVFRGR